MFEARRQHPVASITKVLEIIKGNFITILIILFVGGSGDEETLLNLTWIAGTIIVLLIWGVLSWLRFTYRVEEEQLIIEQGVLMRKKLYISKDRIQIIDISSGIIQRLFGLVEVQVKTAGTSSNDAKISAVSKEMALRLKSELRKDGAGDDEVEETTRREETVHRLGNRELLIAASTSGRFGIALSIVGTVFSQLDQVFSEQQMIRYIESVIPASASTSLVVTSLLFILVVSWIFAFMGTLIKYAGFSIRLREEELVISHGLFERKQLTVPYNRIQAIQVKEELLRQPFGYVSLRLDSAGYGDEGGKSIVLLPLLARDSVSGFLEEVVPEYSAETEAVSPPRASLRRYLVRMLLLAILAVAVLWLIFAPTLYSLLLFVPALLLGYAQYRDASIGTNENTMILRYRLLSRNTVILKKYRIQTVEWSANPLQRRSGLAHFSVTVASGSEGHQFRVRDLAYRQAATYWEWLARYPGGSDSEEDAEKDLRILPAF